VAPRRYALILAALQDRKGRLLDDLTVMLLKFTGRIEWRSAAILDEWQDERRDRTEELVRTLAELLAIMGKDRSACAPTTRLIRRRQSSTTRSS
jgi:hypothetical protein